MVPRDLARRLVDSPARSARCSSQNQPSYARRLPTTNRNPQLPLRSRLPATNARTARPGPKQTGLAPGCALLRPSASTPVPPGPGGPPPPGTVPAVAAGCRTEGTRPASRPPRRVSAETDPRNSPQPDGLPRAASRRAIVSIKSLTVSRASDDSSTARSAMFRTPASRSASSSANSSTIAPA